MSRVSYAASLVVVALALSACPEKEVPPPPPPPVEEDAGVPDAGEPDAGEEPFFCTMDDDCAVFLDGSRCVLEDDVGVGDAGVGTCIPARACPGGMDSECANVDDIDDYCFTDNGVGCRCVAEEGQNICRRRRGACEPCETDSDCGNTTQFDPQGVCKTLAMGTEKFCFQRAVFGTCEAGYVQDPEGFCVPQVSCDQVGCQSDADCPGSLVCNALQAGQTGVCEQPCTWDFARNAPANDEKAPGCPSGKICWVDHKNLDPDSAIFGRGRCRAPCTTDAQCTDTSLNIHGGPRLECAPERIGRFPDSANRCRPAGECMGDVQCPEVNSESTRGYCDRATFTCQTDCRVGNDPTTGSDYDRTDCRVGFYCVDDNGTRSCEVEPCMRTGGRGAACGGNRFCCGEDKDRDGMADPCTDPATGQAVALEQNNCYPAPAPFCATCDPMQPFTSCAMSTPIGGELPTLCLELADVNDAPVAVCTPGTFNDPTRAQTVCPNAHAAQVLYVDCTSDPSVCTNGSATGYCAEDPNRPDGMGGFNKSCRCSNVGTQGGDCPGNSYCHFGEVGSEQSCIHSIVCIPPPYLISTPAPDGCGL